MRTQSTRLFVLALSPVLAAVLFPALFPATSAACTNLLVTPGAAADGAAMITYTCDGVFHPNLRHRPAADHNPDEMLDIRHWDGELYGQIPQAPHTYAINRLMNEHQLAIAETTFDGRLELQNNKAVLHYWDLMQLALQRARTAREAITVMTSLAEMHGYRSTGESFSLADTEECWILEMIGCGADTMGALWVARRLPDGTISAHANMARIGEFPLDDPEYCLYATNLIELATECGYYDPTAGQPFNFRDAFDPATVQKKRYTATRVWSLFRRAAPSQQFSPDFHRGEPDLPDYPLWIEPDRKLSLRDIMNLMRDHYEGTDFDMTQGVDAGPFGNPNRWRPMAWKQDGAEYTWERPISTQQTGFSMIAQCRAQLPDPIGGVLWYGVDDTYTTCWFPLYCCADAMPESYTTGNLGEFSWDSAWWVFNIVANYACLKYGYMIRDIQAVQAELEEEFLTLQPAVEKAALELYEQDPDLARQYLTSYSVGAGEKVTRRWRELAFHLFTKYNDGYVRDEKGHAQEVGYSEAWRGTVLQLRPDQFRLQQAPEDSLTNVLPY